MYSSIKGLNATPTFRFIDSMPHLHFHIWTQCDEYISMYGINMMEISIFGLNTTLTCSIYGLDVIPAFPYIDFVQPTYISIYGLSATTIFPYMDLKQYLYFHIWTQFD